MVLSRGSDALGIVPPHRNDLRNGQQSGCIFLRWFFVCCHGGCGSDMEQVVARWQCPVASGVALNMLLDCICRHRSTWPCHIRSALCCSQCFLLRHGRGVLTVLQRDDCHCKIQSLSLARMCGKWRYEYFEPLRARSVNCTSTWWPSLQHTVFITCKNVWQMTNC